MTNIIDQRQLRLPFYDERHRHLVMEINNWIDSGNLDQVLVSDDGVVQKCKELMTFLGDQGWLKYAVELNQNSAGSNTSDFRSICLIRQAFAFRHDLLDFAFSIQALSSAAISLFATDAQKNYFLPQLSKGKLIGALAMTEPGGGSDLGAIRTSCVANSDSFVLNGEKAYIANSTIADFFLVLVRTDEGPGPLGLSCVIVPKETNGLFIHENLDLLAPRSIGNLTFKNCEIPKDNLIHLPGHGFQVAMTILDLFRPTVAAAALGFARKAINLSRARVTARKIGKKRLVDFGVTKHKLADMITYEHAASLLVSRSAWELDSSFDDVTISSSVAKYFCTDGAEGVIDEATQLFGAEGVITSNEIENLYRQIRLLRIYEGTSDIQRLIISGA